MTTLSAIVAMARNRVIGRNQKLPWSLPEDLKRFKALTWGHPIIMGRKTFESIGRVLPGRENWIVSRNSDLHIPGAKVAASLQQAVRECSQQSGEIFIIGGGEVYREALPLLNRIYLTQIDQDIDGDAYFPEFSEEEFREISREDRFDPMPFSFRVLERKS